MLVLNASFLKMFFKNIFTKRNVMFILMVIATISFLSITIFPLAVSYNIMSLIIAILIGGIVFNSTYKFKKSTLFNNEFYSNIKHKTMFYADIYLMIIILTIIGWFCLMFVLTIFNHFDLILYYWPWQTPPETRFYHYEIWSLYIISVIFYQLIVISTLLFSISFLTRGILTNEKSYMTMIFSFIIFSIFFGGGANSSFSIGPNIIGNQEKEHYWLYSFNGNEALFNLSLFFPFYAPGQMIQCALYNTYYSKEMYVLWHWYSVNDIVYNFPENISYINPMWHWNILYILPWVEIICFTSIGMMWK